MRIEEELKSAKLTDPMIKAGLNIMFTGNWLNNRVENLLKPYGISHQQFNVLRILNGKYPEAANLQDISDRMIDRMSNATRLVEKLRVKGYVTREVCPENRRKVNIRITKEGIGLLNKINPELKAHHDRIYSQITREEAIALNNILDKLRG